MKIELDTHTHTIACNHAYSTITEIAKEAKKKDLKLVCITEHGPQMPGGPHKYFFANIRVVPNQIDGVKILKGIEANIMNVEGTIDLPDEYEDRMEIVLAGLHEMLLPPGSIKENTKAVINTMNREVVDIITHLGNPVYELNYDDIIKAASDTNTFIEINNSSFVHTRKGSFNNCLSIAEKCKKNNVSISLGSDAHFATDVGDYTEALKMLKSIEFPEELVLNTKVDRLLSYLRGKGKVVLQDPRQNIRR
ncbi:PHP domain-containing protein [Alkalibaculum sp. M08DMB]|uniref:PHP domain-containing protein n=1 Tax=Alkalibaculum sporogenes TaxID=2655001 RepID=A0A6A7KAZ0_9FIRM|nr:phosphatase [Alkalibaculum sporogenes]MPW26566.1 PHP domain-containing protein [Alkalibaculum sporogenes]